MLTAIDTSVLLDVIAHQSEHHEASSAALAAARKKGALVVCETVYAELAAAFKGDGSKVDGFLSAAGIKLSRSSEGALINAGKLWQSYRANGGPRTRILPDFLVGGHALEEADVLLVRDRGFFRESFKKLRAVDPTKGDKV
jgi:predicted nucleic acid-binding protein